MASNEIIKTAHTFDGYRVRLWDDGVVSIPFIGSRKIGTAAGFALLGEIEIYDASEFIRAAEVMKRAHTQHWVRPLSHFRNVMAGKRQVLSRNCMGSVGAVTYRERAEP